MRAAARPTAAADDRAWWWLALILLVTFIAYLPALGGEMLWDDPAHLTRPELRSLSGLFRIWFVLGTTQQYYPLTDTLFWLQAMLWGDHYLGYHLVTLGLHLVNVTLVWRILRHLQVPGALLAAGLFALHPVHAESVAWMTQLKNTLSGACYLGAMLCYLRYDESRRARWYRWALVCFALALMAKTVTATLPAAALLLIWYRRGRLEWLRDVRPTLPFFVMGVAGGLFTAWIEHSLVGAGSSTASQPLLSRLLVAGRVPWFYLGSLGWPFHLVFHYPRWRIEPAVWQQWIAPTASFLLLAVLAWQARHRRGMVAAMLFFLGSLFPVLGLLDVYHFRFAFVADHFQYLASLGPLTLVAVGVTALPRTVRSGDRAAYALGGLLLFGCALLTWQRSHLFGKDEIALYQATLEANPNSWIAESNWGAALIRRKQYAEAFPHLKEAMRLEPNAPEPFHDAGVALAALDRKNEAIEMYAHAVLLDRDFWRAQYLLGDAYASQGRFTEAVGPLREAVRGNPKFAQAQFNLAGALLATGSPEEGVIHLGRAEALAPEALDLQARIATLYAKLGLTARAKVAAERAYRLAVAQGAPGIMERMQALMLSP